MGYGTAMSLGSQFGQWLDLYRPGRRVGVCPLPRRSLYCAGYARRRRLCARPFMVEGQPR